MTGEVTVVPGAVDAERLKQRQAQLGGVLAGCVTAAMIYLGDRLGLYQALQGSGAVTSLALAEATGLHERWLREWLQSQAAAGLLDYRGDGAFELSLEVALLLADENSLQFMGATFHGQIARMGNLGRMPGAFRTGRGIAWDERDADSIVAMERSSGPWFRNLLVSRALPALDGVVERLRAGGKVADLGCGSGIALIEMAKAFPDAAFRGYEAASNVLLRAEANREQAGVTNLSFHHAVRDPLPADGSFDLITTFDCMHDMTRPLETAKAIRAALAPDGCWFIADIDGRDGFEANLAGNPAAGVMYGISILGCLASGLSEPDGAGLGALGLPEPVMRRLAEEAGFSRFSRVPLPSGANAFYSVRP